MESERETLKRALMIIIILVLLALLTRFVYQERKLTNTGGKIEDVISLTEEQKLIIEVKQDESDLKNLYQRADICSEQWIEDFLALANKGEIVLLYFNTKSKKRNGHISMAIPSEEGFRYTCRRRQF